MTAFKILLADNHTLVRAGIRALLEQIPNVEAEVKKEFNVNVVSATQAAVWDGLRLAGVTDKIAGYGRLFSEF